MTIHNNCVYHFAVLTRKYAALPDPFRRHFPQKNSVKGKIILNESTQKNQVFLYSAHLLGKAICYSVGKISLHREEKIITQSSGCVRKMEERCELMMKELICNCCCVDLLSPLLAEKEIF